MACSVAGRGASFQGAQDLGNGRSLACARGAPAPGDASPTVSRRGYYLRSPSTEVNDGGKARQGDQAGAGSRRRAVHGDDLAGGGSHRSEGTPQGPRDLVADHPERRCGAHPAAQDLPRRVDRFPRECGAMSESIAMGEAADAVPATATATAARPWKRAAIAASILGAMLYGATHALGPAPALGPLLDPLHGIWAS